VHWTFISFDLSDEYEIRDAAPCQYTYVYLWKYCSKIHDITFKCTTVIIVHVQMDAYNLAIMFGPALVRPHDDDMAAMLKDMNDQSQIVESLIRHVSYQLLY